MRQTSNPERTRSLPNRHLNLSDEDLAMQSSRDFRWRCRLEEKSYGFYQIALGFFYGSTLAGNVEFGTEGYESIIFAFNNCSNPVRSLHEYSLC